MCRHGPLSQKYQLSGSMPFVFALLYCLWCARPAGFGEAGLVEVAGQRRRSRGPRLGVNVGGGVLGSGVGEVVVIARLVA